MKENYRIIFDSEIKKIKELGKKPTLLLHACCAPCSSAVLEVLREYFDITIFFFNPNISPRAEFEFRLEELKRLVLETGLLSEIISPEYDEKEFFDIAKGLEDLPEGGKRCEGCYRLRLLKTAEYAKEKGFDYFTTTLTVSPYKNAEKLNQIGLELEKEQGTCYLVSDFKKADGYKRSIELSKKHNLYRQNYCGCVYSKKQGK